MCHTNDAAFRRCCWFCEQSSCCSSRWEWAQNHQNDAAAALEPDTDICNDFYFCFLARFSLCLDGWSSFRGNCYFLGNFANSWANAEVRRHRFHTLVNLFLCCSSMRIMVPVNLPSVSHLWHTWFMRLSLKSVCRASVPASGPIWPQSTVSGSTISSRGCSKLEVTPLAGLEAIILRFVEQTLQPKER